jgi:hypothetical protein
MDCLRTSTPVLLVNRFVIASNLAFPLVLMVSHLYLAASYWYLNRLTYIPCLACSYSPKTICLQESISIPPLDSCKALLHNFYHF